jgi:23S rRNA pseudouridine2604 synthase
VLNQRVELDPHASLLGVTDITLVLHKPCEWLDGTQPGFLPPQQAGRRPKAQDARSLLAMANRQAADASGMRVTPRQLSQLTGFVPLETGASGLLVFSQDWRVQRKLTESMGSLEHECIVDVDGEVEPDRLRPMLHVLNDPQQRLPAVKVSVNSANPQGSKLRFAIVGAHPGLVAYLCEKAGLQMTAMRRIRLGRVALRDLPPGQWRALSEEERF